MAHALPRDFSFVVESVFAQTETDWPTNGRPVNVIEPDVTGFDLDVRANENIRPRRLAPNRKILGLKSGSTETWAHYFTASGATAAPGAQAVSTDQSTIYKSALGGEALGFSVALDGTGTPSAPGFVADPGYVKGDWVFAYDTSGSIGEFRRVEAAAPTSVTLLEDLSFTPDAADILHATITNYPDEQALNDWAHANNTTLGTLIQGEATDDVYVAEGVKPTLSFGSFTAGEEIMAEIEAAVTTYPQPQPAKQTIPGTPSGIAPSVVATGRTASVRLADFGSPLAAVDCRGSIEISTGIGWEGVTGVCGTEGIKGYLGTVEDGQVTLTLAYNSDYDDAFSDGQILHLQLQFGDQPTTAVGFYFPRLEIIEKPDRVDEQGTTSITLVMRPLEDTADSSGLTGDELALRRAPMVIMMAA